MRATVAFILFTIIAFPLIVCASPYIACDVQQGVEWYEIQGFTGKFAVNNNKKLTPVAKAACEGGVACSTILDLEGLSTSEVSPLKLRIRSCNVRGCSATWTSFRIYTSLTSIYGTAIRTYKQRMERWATSP
jgi:hypothetical protein